MVKSKTRHRHYLQRFHKIFSKKITKIQTPYLVSLNSLFLAQIHEEGMEILVSNIMTIKEEGSVQIMIRDIQKMAGDGVQAFDGIVVKVLNHLGHSENEIR